MEGLDLWNYIGVDAAKIIFVYAHTNYDSIRRTCRLFRDICGDISEFMGICLGSGRFNEFKRITSYMYHYDDNKHQYIPVTGDGKCEVKLFKIYMKLAAVNSLENYDLNSNKYKDIFITEKGDFISSSKFSNYYFKIGDVASTVINLLEILILFDLENILKFIIDKEIKFLAYSSSEIFIIKNNISTFKKYEHFLSNTMFSKELAFILKLDSISENFDREIFNMIFNAARFDKVSTIFHSNIEDQISTNKIMKKVKSAYAAKVLIDTDLYTMEKNN